MNSIILFCKRWISENKYFILALLFVLSLRMFVFTFARVDGESMYPNLKHGDMLFIDKLSYRFRKPSVGDIVVFPYAGNPKEKYVKRIIAGPNSVVEIKDQLLFINGEEVTEEFLENEMESFRGDRDYPITLGTDEYFVMGDNRNVSLDSRYRSVGNIKEKNIIGKASFRIFPLRSKHDLY